VYQVGNKEKKKEKRDVKFVANFANFAPNKGVSEDLTDTVRGLRSGPYKGKPGTGKMSSHFITPLKYLKFYGENVGAC
jgi:hypothetical protein